MKILVFIWRDITHPQAGGSELFVHEITKRWVKAGHRITFLCGSYKGSKRCAKIDSVKIIRRGGRYTLYFWAFWIYLTRLRKKKFDVVIDVENGIPFFTPLFISKPKLAVLYHIHKQVFFRELPFYLAWIPYFLEVVVMPILYRRTKFITISNSSRNEMVKYGFKDSNIKIIYPGVDLEKYKSNGNIEKPTFFNVVYLGRLKKYKGVDILIKAMKLVVKEIPKAKLIILGRGEREQELKHLVKRFSLENNVEFHGFVPESNKIKMLQKADILVCPSFKEGWGITVVEANACGVPVIASDVSGLRDSVIDGKTGFLVPYGNSEEISRKIIILFRDKRLREDLRKNALEWASRFSWEKSAQESLAFIEKITLSELLLKSKSK